MSQTASSNGIVNEKLETAINIGCTMVSRSKKVRKKIKSSTDDNASLLKSMKELDKMSIDLIDKLVEINTRIDLRPEDDTQSLVQHGKFHRVLGNIIRASRNRIEKMKLAYQDMLTL